MSMGLAQVATPAATGHDAVYGEDNVADVPLTDEFQWGLYLHTEGGGLTLRRGVYRDAFRIASWGMDALILKHPKEEKTSNPVYEDGRPYVYGKVNTFQTLRVWRGHQRVFSEKLRKDAVRLSVLWKYGVSLGVLKPIYLEIGYPDIPYDYISTERYDPNVHFSDDIYGRAAWLNGLDQLQVMPGVHVSAAVDFEYGTKRHVTRTLTAGIGMDAFWEQPEILANKFEQNQRIIVTLFATLELGSNWTR